MYVRVGKVNRLNEYVSDLFKIVNNRDLKICDTINYKESSLKSKLHCKPSKEFKRCNS